jgi:hypothetical protein
VMAVPIGPQGIDAQACPKLTADDLTPIKALVDTLAVVVVSLQAQGARCKTPWKHWLDLAHRMRSWLQATPVPQISIEAAEPPKALKAPKATKGKSPATTQRKVAVKRPSRKKTV